MVCVLTLLSTKQLRWWIDVCIWYVIHHDVSCHETSAYTGNFRLYLLENIKGLTRSVRGGNTDLLSICLNEYLLYDCDTTATNCCCLKMVDKQPLHKSAQVLWVSTCVSWQIISLLWPQISKLRVVWGRVCTPLWSHCLCSSRQGWAEAKRLWMSLCALMQFECGSGWNAQEVGA